MDRLRAFAALLTLLLLCPLALADGKVFSTFPDPAGAQIPDQQALICFQKGVETLAIETRFSAKGDDFAWVVPLPSVPALSPTTTGLFPTLHAACAPAIEHRPGEFLVPLLYLSVVVLIVLFLCKGPWRALGVLAILLVGGFCILLPAFGKARALAEGPLGQVDVLDRRVVGSYETAVIQSADAAALSTWLTEHGYLMPQPCGQVIADYVAKGWVFAVARLRNPSAAEAPITPHPLVFTFASQDAVYPMRLTGANAQGPLTLDLFVFADHRATARGMQVLASAPVAVDTTPKMYRPWKRVGPDIEVSHPELARLVGAATFGTHLRGRFEPAEMRSDLVLGWEGSSTTGRLAYTQTGAWRQGLQLGLLVLCVGLAAGRAIELAAGWRTGRSIAWVVGGAALSCTCLALSLPTVATVSGSRSTNRVFELAYALKEQGDVRGTVTAEWARNAVAAGLAMRGVDAMPPGETPLREEDSPGNYVFEVRDGMLYLVMIDLAGRAWHFELGRAPEDPPTAK